MLVVARYKLLREDEGLCFFDSTSASFTRRPPRLWAMKMIGRSRLFESMRSLTTALSKESPNCDMFSLEAGPLKNLVMAES